MLFFRSGRALSVAVLLSLSLAGCSSFVASTTGAGPVGVVSGDRSFAQIITDNGIVKTAEINLYKLDPRFNFSRVNISSFHSVVLLTGQVPDGYLKQLAEQNVRSMTDVKAVHNYITVGPKADYNAIVQDGMVTANIRRNILLLKTIKDTRVKVVTESGTVYVMGRLMPSESVAIMDVLQRTPNISKIVSLVDVLADAAPSLLPAGSVAANHIDGTVVAAPVVAVTPLALDPRESPTETESTSTATPVTASESSSVGTGLSVQSLPAN